jgi:hypothetical protein
MAERAPWTMTWHRPASVKKSDAAVPCSFRSPTVPMLEQDYACICCVAWVALNAWCLYQLVGNVSSTVATLCDVLVSSLLLLHCFFRLAVKLDNRFAWVCLGGQC